MASVYTGASVPVECRGSTTDRSGWNHIYIYDNDLNACAVTSGEWRVNSINEIDDGGGWIYFTGRPNKSWDAQLMRVRFDGSGMEQLTEGDGVHSARVSPGGTYFIGSVSNIHEPTKVTLHNGDGSAVRELGNAPPEPEVSLPRSWLGALNEGQRIRARYCRKTDRSQASCRRQTPGSRR